jgi:ERCC4-type nuclease
MSKKNNIMENLDTFEGIIIDTREPMEKFAKLHDDFAVHAKSSEEVPNCQFHALPYGDYLICTKNYRLLIERKEFHDYCRSIGKYLEERFNHMRIENDLTMLLVEGNPEMMDQNAVYR